MRGSRCVFLPAATIDAAAVIVVTELALPDLRRGAFKGGPAPLFPPTAAGAVSTPVSAEPLAGHGSTPASAALFGYTRRGADKQHPLPPSPPPRAPAPCERVLRPLTDTRKWRVQRVRAQPVCLFVCAALSQDLTHCGAEGGRKKQNKTYKSPCSPAMLVNTRQYS